MKDTAGDPFDPALSATLQKAKATVGAMYAALDAGGTEGVQATLSGAMVPDTVWRGPHPFERCEGPEAIADAFWRPFHSAFAPVLRRW